MDVDVRAIEAWGLRAKGEGYLRTLLSELAQPTLGAVRQALGGDSSAESAARLLMTGKSASQPIVGWRDQPHISYAVPAGVNTERLRVQFAAMDGGTYFSVEARYQHPKERLEDADVAVATQYLQAAGFRAGNDGWGHYWAKVAGTELWAHPNESLHRLLALTRGAVNDLARSGIFPALNALRPTTPTSVEPQVE